MFVHDPAIVTDRGAVILRMGKKLRRGEEASMARALEGLRVPISATLRGEATAEGGDLLWVNHDELEGGRGFRTTAEGRRQVRQAMRSIGVAGEPASWPAFHGP